MFIVSFTISVEYTVKSNEEEITKLHSECDKVTSDNINGIDRQNGNYTYVLCYHIVKCFNLCTCYA